MKLKSLLFLMLITCLTGFNVSDEVELDQFLNARTTPDFRKYTKNIQTTLAKGTQGKVAETKLFASGNSGIKLQITSGPKTGESYWVYFNKKQPGLKLINQASQEVQKPEEASEAVTKRDIAARRDMNEHALGETARMAVLTLKSNVSTGITNAQLPCPAMVSTVVERKTSDVSQERTSDTTMEAFERVEARSSDGCTRQSNGDGYSINNIIDCRTNAVLFPSGFTFSDGPGHPYLSGAKSSYADDAGTPARAIDFVSKDKALNETYLYLTDVAGGPDSHDVKSVMVILPRKGVPSTEVIGDDVIVTLTTGEKVIFDKKTNAIKSGAMKEGPIDLTTDRFKRTPPNVHYTGSGISIRVDHRFEYPTHGAATAEVRQGTRVCKVPKTKIWDKAGNPLTNDDQSLLNVLNSSCPRKGSEKPFSL